MFKIGDRVKVIDQPDIIGTIIRYDSGNKVVIRDEDNSWAEEGEDPTLVFRQSELTQDGLVEDKDDDDTAGMLEGLING